MDKMLKSPNRLVMISRPRSFLLIAFAALTTYLIIFSGPSAKFQVVPYLHEKFGGAGKSDGEKSWLSGQGGGKLSEAGDAEYYTTNVWGINLEDLRKWKDVEDPEDFTNVEPGEERDGTPKNKFQIGNLQFEKDLRKMWRFIYKKTAKLSSSNAIYGKTLAALDHQNDRSPSLEKHLREDPSVKVSFSKDQPVRFNPYPDYNSKDRALAGYAPHVPCNGPNGEETEDALVFRGRPQNWPEAKLGSYAVLGLDANICWERETRLGPYGLTEKTRSSSGGGGGNSNADAELWSNVNWGDLQKHCVNRNANRYELNRKRGNPYLAAYPETARLEDETRDSDQGVDKRASTVQGSSDKDPNRSLVTGYVPEKRTAVLLRSYLGMHYTENDKQVIRALVTELSLKSGGEYEVFILLHVKDRELKIFDNSETYQAVLDENVPQEFHGMTVLWNDEAVWDIYIELDDEYERSVHSAQWLSVQKFSRDHPQFDFFWNFEMDFRYTGHHYELLDKIDQFARRQPRRGSWERNAQWYVPEFHGDYDTAFRLGVEERYGNDTIWGAPDVPFINPLGPTAPVSSPWEDNYEWGVGEDADIITVSPMFDPVNSNWIIGDDIWKYRSETFDARDLPRRATIVTQARVSRRLLDAMHVENRRGNHIASEMTPQTVALLHGFKAVFAPHPVFADRDWDGHFLNSWFNPGDNGDTSGYGSPMGWGRERRYEGNTWYYRAEPPNRLYNNWMGWVDHDMGGKQWERLHGRPCLPSVMLHPIKNTEVTGIDHRTAFELVFG